MWEKVLKPLLIGVLMTLAGAVIAAVFIGALWLVVKLLQLTNGLIIYLAACWLIGSAVRRRANRA